MTKRFTSVSLVAAFVVGLVGGALIWDQIGDDAQGSRGRSSQVRTPRIGPDADLLDVVLVVESLPQVKPCRMVEMFEYSPLAVRAFCPTTVGDEVRIVHHNDSSAQEADIAAFCDLGDGQAFIPLDARWSLYQVPGNTPAGPDPGLTTELTNALAVETVECG